jgi:hypothetical protein
MHPILADRRRLLIYLSAWFVVGASLAVGLEQDGEWLAALVVLLPVSLVYAFVCLSAWYPCRAFPLDGKTRAWTLAVVHGLASVVASGMWTAASQAWAGTLDDIFGSFGAARLYEGREPLLFVVGVLLYWFAVVFHYLLIAFEASREAERRAIEVHLLAREAELKALRAQIDPHFIFNSLHSISALTASNPAAARRMCLLLADFLRETLRLGASAQITLADELKLADRFLAIEQVRLGERLQISRETDPETLACLVPPLLLQPLLENAVVHGVAQMVDGGLIRMVAARDAGLLTITIENPCDPDRARSRGVGLGLTLLQQRLLTQCGVHDGCRAAEEAGRFRVEVRMPAVTAA